MNTSSHIKTQSSPGREGGVALLITLIILGMIVFLLVAFLTTMRSERIISKSFTDQVRARLAAQAGVDNAVNLLTAATTNANYITAVNNPNWAMPSIQQPLLEVWATAQNLVPALINTISSGIAVPASTDFNRNEMLAASNHVNRPFNFNWTYLTNNTTTVNARYAFWVDDESMKINLLTAGTNTATFGSDPLEINMTSLPQIGTTRAGDILANRGGGFETLETMRESTPMTQHEYNTAKFYTTIYSSDSGSNYLGQSPSNLNTLLTTNITAIATTLSNLCPAVANKYADGRWLQFAANLKEYANPTRQPTNENLLVGGYPLIGRNSTPLINEFTVSSLIAYAGQVNGSNQFICTNTLSIELFNIYSKDYINPQSALLVAPGIPPMVISNTADSVTHPAPWIGSISNLGTTIARSCATFSTSAVTSVFFPTSGYSGIVIIRPAATSPIYVHYTNAAGLVDYANIPLATQDSGAVAILQGVAPSGSLLMFTNEVVTFPGDPRINHQPANWTYTALSTPNTTNSTFSPAGGGDGDNSLQWWNDGGVYWRNGPIQSIAEIGLIPTGWASNMWTTIKLYSEGNATSATNADYMLLDYVTITNGPRARINLNAAKEYPSTPAGVLCSLLGNASIPTSASTPLSLSSLSSILPTLPIQLATNIVAVSQAIGPYWSIGNFLQLNSNLLSQADTASQNTDWRREGPLRSIANVLTVRGEQFTIYGIGQSLQITPGGRVTNVLGEAYLQTVVERVVVPGAFAPTNIYYRPLYNRFLIE